MVQEGSVPDAFPKLHQWPPSSAFSPSGFLFIINIVVVFLFLLACLVPYLNPQSWWFISFLGLGLSVPSYSGYFFAVGWLTS